MDILTTTDMEQLTRPTSTGTHVSLFMPTHRLGSDTDALRWKNLVSGVEHELSAAGLRRNEIEELLAPAHELQADNHAWRYMSDGLAMFLSPGWSARFRVPVPLPSVATVGERFVTGPLVPLLARDGHFMLLTVSQREVRLLEGSRQRVEEIDPVDMPVSLEDVVEAPEPRSDAMARAVSRGGRGGRAVFYGYGAADEHFKRDDIILFLREVAGHVDSFLAGQGVPLVLVGLAEQLTAYRSVSSYPHILDDDVRTNPDGLSPEELHERAWPVMAAQLERQRAEVTDRLGELGGTGRTATNLADVAQAASEGRVDTLVFAAEPWRWETNGDESSVIRLGAEDAPDDQRDRELLDTAITETLAQGGRVQALRESEGVTEPVAAILRF